MMSHLLEGLAVMIAPLTPHMAEDVWQAVPYDCGGARSIFQAGWGDCPPKWAALATEDREAVAAMLAVRDLANKVCESARNAKAIGANLDAEVRVHAEDPRLVAALERLSEKRSNGSGGNGVDELKFCLIVSEARMVENACDASDAPFSASEALDGFEGKVTIGVGKAGGHKCSRCWLYSSRVGFDNDHPELCERCSPVIRGMGVEPPPKGAPAPAAA